MKPPVLLFFLLIIILVSCKNDAENPEPEPEPETILSDKTLILDKNISSISLIEVDSTKIIFAASGTDLSKIQVGSILVSDMNDKAPNGFLRKVTSVIKSDGKITCETVQASLTDAIVKGSVSFKKSFTDNDILGVDSSGVDISLFDKSKSAQMPSFSFSYKMTFYDSDQKKETIDDQIYVEGKMELEPTIYFDLDIENSKIKYFRVQMDLKNLIHVKATAKIKLPVLNDEQVLYTFPMAPYTIPIAGIPVPIAKQWIVIVLGIDGNISAKMVCGVQNTNTAKAGIIYENSSWDVFTGVENSFELVPITFEGEAKIEPWLQARYEIRPYALQQSRIFIGARGSVIGEAKLVPQGLDLSLKWGVKLTAKAQMVVFDQSILNYENELYTKEFPIKQWSSYAFPTLSTNSVSNITQSSATCGGNVTSDGGAMVTGKGVCWNTTGTPTINNSKTTDGTGTGSFASSLTGLYAGTTYYVRAYATNSQGTSYGSQLSFRTSQSIGLPIVNTNSITNISLTTASGGGNVTSDGGASVTARGVCWNTTGTPTINNSKTTDGTGTGSFVSNLTGLTVNTTYYVRAYAINSQGTAYGSQMPFTTLGGGANTITDIDGNVYQTVTIGAQTWIAENLKTTKYRDGIEIPNVTDSNTWRVLTSGAYCWYNNDARNKSTYGALYNWHAINTGKLCPTGWHVPSDAELTTLSTFLGGESVAGGKMKETGTAHWASPNIGATNESGFLGLPGGVRDASQTFFGIGLFGYWWSSTEYSTIFAFRWSLGYSYLRHDRGMIFKEYGFSVRCLRD